MNSGASVERRKNGEVEALAIGFEEMVDIHAGYLDAIHALARAPRLRKLLAPGEQRRFDSQRSACFLPPLGRRTRWRRRAREARREVDGDRFLEPRVFCITISCPKKNLST